MFPSLQSVPLLQVGSAASHRTRKSWNSKMKTTKEEPEDENLYESTELTDEELENVIGGQSMEQHKQYIANLLNEYKIPMDRRGFLYFL